MRSIDNMYICCPACGNDDINKFTFPSLTDDFHYPYCHRCGNYISENYNYEHEKLYRFCSISRPDEGDSIDLGIKDNYTNEKYWEIDEIADLLNKIYFQNKTPPPKENEDDSAIYNDKNDWVNEGDE